MRFLNAGDKVKVTIMFRGREQSRPELGFRLLQRLSADVAELGFVESAPKQDGRNMIMVLAPHKRPGQRQPQPARSVSGDRFLTESLSGVAAASLGSAAGRCPAHARERGAPSRVRGSGRAVSARPADAGHDDQHHLAAARADSTDQARRQRM